MGFVVGAGLLLQFGLTPLGWPQSWAVHAMSTATQINVATIAGVLVFSAIAFAPLAFFLRGTRRQAQASTIEMT